MILAKTGLFRAAVDFYGRPPKSLEGACPIVASYGGKDAAMHGEIPRLRAQLSEHAIPNDLKVYQRAGHGFMTVTPNAALRIAGRLSPLRAGFEPAAAADAKERMLAFLGTHV
jgi:carboxymethylenebutenolidase